MQPPSDEKKIGLWKKIYKDKNGQEKTMLTGTDGELQYSIFTNDFKTESKHPDYRMNVKPKIVREVPISTQIVSRQHNAHRPHTEDDLPF